MHSLIIMIFQSQKIDMSVFPTVSNHNCSFLLLIPLLFSTQNHDIFYSGLIEIMKPSRLSMRLFMIGNRRLY